jgi:membrane protease YdiL (CAAX protease family)
VGHHPVIAHLGLARGAPFLGDPQFAVALVIGSLAAVVLGHWGSAGQAPGPALWMGLAMVVWTPLLEELLFRGVIQGELRQHQWALRSWLGFTGANVATSVLFAAAHLISQSLTWSLAAFAPSLIFGYFRDRHDNLWPAFALHACFNGAFILPGAL